MNANNLTVGLMDRKTFDFKKTIPILSLVMIAGFFMIISKGKIVELASLKTILDQCFILMIGCVGYLFILAEGNLDFSIGAGMGVSVAVATQAAIINIWLAIPVCILTGALIGAINGFIHAKLKLSSFITTVAMQFVLSGLVVILLKGTILPVPFAMLAWDTIQFKIIVLTVVLVIGFIVFNYTPYGRYCKAIGACEEAVRQTGINTKLMRFIPFVVMGVIVGILGIYTMISSGTASNHTGEDLMMDVLSAILLGGIPLTGGATSKFRAVVIGSLIMAILGTGMTLMGVDSQMRQLIKGVIFLLAVALSFERKNVRVIK